MIEIVAPEQLGLDANRISALLQRAQRGLDEGHLPSLQMAIARGGRIALFTTLGEADNSRRYNIFSCTKPLVASAIWKLMAEADLDIERPVCDYIAGFSSAGKEIITVEQLLLHTAGIPHAPMGPPVWFERESRLEKMASWRLNWEPGSRTEYHANSAHWALAEIIECVSGTDYRVYIARHILSPLNLQHFQLGVPLQEQADIMPLVSVGDPPGSEELEKILGVAMEWPEVSHEHLLAFNDPQTRALGVPGAGGVADAASVALFYQCLLQNSGELWDEAILRNATSRIRNTHIDPASGIAANRGLGVVIAGDDQMAARRGMGKNVSPRCFGHPGMGGQIAWGDPETGISFCLLTNGLDANPIRAARFGAAMSAYAAAVI